MYVKQYDNRYYCIVYLRDTVKILSYQNVIKMCL